MNSYYRLITFQGRQVVFTDSTGKRDARHFNDFLNDGFLEFFSQDDATRILAQAQSQNLGHVLSRLGTNNKVWVPYQRYRYFPFLGFTAFGALLLSCFLTQHHIAVGDKTLYGSFFVLPLTFIVTDLVNELFGYQMVKRMIQTSAALLFLIAALIHGLKDTVALFSVQHNIAWLGISDRLHILLMINAMALLCADLFNAWTFHKLRMWAGNQYFWLRSLLSTTISQIVYSSAVIVIYIVFECYTVPTAFDLETFLFLFNNIQVKFAYSVALLPVMYLICRLIKSKDLNMLRAQIQKPLSTQYPLASSQESS